VCEGKVALDSAVAKIEPGISNRKYNALTATPPSHIVQYTHYYNIYSQRIIHTIYANTMYANVKWPLVERLWCNLPSTDNINVKNTQYTKITKYNYTKTRQTYREYLEPKITGAYCRV